MIWSRWSRPALPLVVVGGLLCLGAANIASRATWREVEDGVLWREQAEGVVAAEIAPGTPAAARRVCSAATCCWRSTTVRSRTWPTSWRCCTRRPRRRRCATPCCGSGTREVIDVRLAPVPGGPGALYFVLAAVGTFTLLVGGAVRLRRPRDPATLHFFWLAVAFFGVFTFSFSGRLDRLDWVFYWADAISILALPPLFLHFTLVFPERPRRWSGGAAGHALVRRCVRCRPSCWASRASSRSREARAMPRASSRVTATLDRLEFLYLASVSSAAWPVLARARRRSARSPRAGSCAGSRGAPRSGAAPFALGYALPYALGVEPSLPMELSAIPLSLIPLAYASAIVRYRLMDIEVIVKRALVYAAALAAIVVIYAVLLEAVQRVFLSGNGAEPVGDRVPRDAGRGAAGAAGEDLRAERARPRVLSRSLRLPPRAASASRAISTATSISNRLAERLVSRVVETLLVDRMALMLEDEVDAALRFDARVGLRRRPSAGAAEALRASARRLCDGHIVALDDPTAVGRFAAEEIEFWRDAGLYYFVPCVAKDGTIAVLALGRKDTGEPLSSEDMALLAAVAGQIATALENARLYRQLHMKARRARSDARVQREHPRVARRRAARGRPRTIASCAGTARSSSSTACSQRRRDGPRARRRVRRAVRRGDPRRAPRYAGGRDAVAGAARRARSQAPATR